MNEVVLRDFVDEKGPVNETIEIAKGLDETIEPVMGLGFHSPPSADVDNDELWSATLKAICSVFIEHDELLGNKLHQSAYGKEQNVYIKEQVNETVLRDFCDSREKNFGYTSFDFVNAIV